GRDRRRGLRLQPLAAGYLAAAARGTGAGRGAEPSGRRVAGPARPGGRRDRDRSLRAAGPGRGLTEPGAPGAGDGPSAGQHDPERGAAARTLLDPRTAAVETGELGD